MRYRNQERQTRNGWLRRQAWIVLLGAAPTAVTVVAAVAEQPLPLQIGGATGQVRPNPFCPPDLQAPDHEVLLASGDQQPARKLNAIGKAVGLRALDASQTSAASPQIVNRSKLSIDPVTPNIQQNPLIESTHHADRSLVETQVIDRQPSAADAARRQTRSTLLKPAANMTVAVRPVPLTDPSAETEPAEPAGPAELDAATLTAPVRITLSDHDLDPADDQPAPAPAPVEVAQVIPGPTPEPPLLPPGPEASADWREASRIETLDAAEPDTSNTALLAAKRYRPPVAVTTVPLVIQRDGRAAPSRSAVRTVPTLDLDRGEAPPSESEPLAATNVATPGEPETTPLQLGLAQVRSLTVGGKLRSVEIGDAAVCRAIATGPSQLKLIGTGHGVTRLVVWADPLDPAPQTTSAQTTSAQTTSAQTTSPPAAAPRAQYRVFEVQVSSSAEDAGDALVRAAQSLNRSIAQAFPSCQVTVLADDRELTVTGRCDSQANARQIMRLVRKTCLVPVDDRLTID